MDWLWWLTLGLAIGWGVEWLIDWRYWRRQRDQQSADLQRLRAGADQAVTLRLERERLHADLRAMRDQVAATESVAAAAGALRERVAELEAALADCRAESAAGSQGFALGGAALAPAAPDPLVDINGIGPVYQSKLFAAGVTTFAQLATLSPVEIEAIIAPERWQAIDAAAWIAEARARADQQGAD